MRLTHPRSGRETPMSIWLIILLVVIALVVFGGFRFGRR
jgi:hypothetical protein